MCMSTTGFGPQVLRTLPQSLVSTQTSHSPSTTYTSVSEPDARSDTEMTGFTQNTSYFQQRRPIPRFDMNLRDLFSDDETDKRSFSRISNQINSMRPPPAPQAIKQEPQHIQTFNADTLKISPQLRSHPQNFASFDPNLRPPQTLPSPQATQTQNPFPPSSNPTLSPPLSQGPMQSPYQISNTLPYNAFSQQITSTYPELGFSDLDFLDSFPVQGSNSVNATSDAAGGLQDLGFGMGFGDGTHDWSDGNGFDLFDGFFFGPQGAGGGI